MPLLAGLVLSYSRPYNAACGRWGSRDFLRSMNRYGFVLQKPSRLVDPSGLDPWAMEMQQAPPWGTSQAPAWPPRTARESESYRLWLMQRENPLLHPKTPYGWWWERMMERLAREEAMRRLWPPKSEPPRYEMCWFYTGSSKVAQEEFENQLRRGEAGILGRVTRVKMLKHKCLCEVRPLGDATQSLRHDETGLEVTGFASFEDWQKDRIFAYTAAAGVALQQPPRVSAPTGSPPPGLDWGSSASPYTPGTGFDPAQESAKLTDQFVAQSASMLGAMAGVKETAGRRSEWEKEDTALRADFDKRCAEHCGKRKGQKAPKGNT